MSAPKLIISLCDIKCNPSEEVLSLCRRSSFCSGLFGKPKVILKRYQIQDEENWVHVRKKSIRLFESDEESENERSKVSSSHDEENRVHVRKKSIRLFESDEESENERSKVSSSHDEENRVHGRKKSIRLFESDEEYESENERSKDSSSHEDEGNTVRAKRKMSKNLGSDEEKENQVHAKKKVSRNLEPDKEEEDQVHAKRKASRNLESDEEENNIHVRKKSLRHFETDEESEPENEKSGDISGDEENGPENEKKGDISSNDEYGLESETSEDTSSDEDYASESSGYTTSDVDFEPDSEYSSSSDKDYSNESENSEDSTYNYAGLRSFEEKIERKRKAEKEDCVSESSGYTTSDLDFEPDSEFTEYSSSSDKDYSNESENSEDSTYNYAGLRYFEKKIERKRKERKALSKSAEKSTADLREMLITLKKNIKPSKRKEYLRSLPRGSRLRSRRLVKSHLVNFEETALYLRSLVKTQEAKDGEHKRKQFLKEREKTRKARIKRNKSFASDNQRLAKV